MVGASAAMASNLGGPADPACGQPRSRRSPRSSVVGMSGSWRLRGYTVERLLGRGASGEVWRAHISATGDAGRAETAARCTTPTAPPRARRGGDAVGARPPAPRPAARPRARRRRRRARARPRRRRLAGRPARRAGPADARRGRSPRWRRSPPRWPTCTRRASCTATSAPANILFTGGGVPLLADLGVARLTGDDSDAESTPAYVDPTVAAGCVPGPPSDVFMLGAVALHALTGDAAVAGRARPDEVLDAGARGRARRRRRAGWPGRACRRPMAARRARRARRSIRPGAAPRPTSRSTCGTAGGRSRSSWRPGGPAPSRTRPTTRSLEPAGHGADHAADRAQRWPGRSPARCHAARAAVGSAGPPRVGGRPTPLERPRSRRTTARRCRAAAARPRRCVGRARCIPRPPASRAGARAGWSPRRRAVRRRWRWRRGRLLARAGRAPAGQSAATHRGSPERAACRLRVDRGSRPRSPPTRGRRGRRRTPRATWLAALRGLDALRSARLRRPRRRRCSAGSTCRGRCCTADTALLLRARAAGLRAGRASARPTSTPRCGVAARRRDGHRRGPARPLDAAVLGATRPAAPRHRPGTAHRPVEARRRLGRRSRRSGSADPLLSAAASGPAGDSRRVRAAAQDRDQASSARSAVSRSGGELNPASSSGGHGALAAEHVAGELAERDPQREAGHRQHGRAGAAPRPSVR